MALILPSTPTKTTKRQPRNWKKYNEKLIQRGDINFYLEALETWTEDLAVLNLEKSGHKYKYPPSIIFLACILRFMFHLPYRLLEGFLRTLGKQFGFPVPNYSTFQKRMIEIDLREWLPQKPLSGDLVLALDASGIKIDNYSDWMRHKWHEKAKTRRGWIKMHIIVDTASHTIIDVEITKEDIGDQDEFIPLVESALKQDLKIKRVLGDGIFDTRENHNYLHQNKIAPGIPPRKNASNKARGSMARAAEVEFYKNYGEKVWKVLHEYNKRVAVKQTFSAFKQIFGEGVMSRKWENIQHELKNKFWLLNWNFNRPVKSKRNHINEVVSSIQ
jgi:hypothetical protein